MAQMEQEESLKAKVRNQMLEVIGAMNLNYNTKLLSENQLANKLQVSRSTIRAVLTELEREGKVIRRHGSGTYVNPLALNVETTIHSRINMHDLILKNGYKPTVQLKEVREEPAQSWCDSLGIQPLEMVCEVHSTFLADGKPCIYCVDCIQAKTLSASQWKGYDNSQTSIFDFLRNETNIEILWDIIRIRSSDSNRFPPLRDFFEISPGEVKSVVLLEITNFDSKNEPVLVGNIYVDTDIICLNIIHDMLHMQ